MKKIYAVILIAALLCTTACSLKNLVPEDARSQPYSEVEEPWTSKDDINYNDPNVYKKYAAGFVKLLDERDEEGIKKMFSKGLLLMEDTEEELDSLLKNFKGNVKDTTYLSGSLGARGYAQWSKTEPIACYDSRFFIYTDEETYYVDFGMCAVDESSPDGRDSVGITFLYVMTLDKACNMKRDVKDKTEDSKEYLNVLTFSDGTTKEVKCKTVGTSNCCIDTEFGSGEGYTVLNLTDVWSKNEVFRLTGTKDDISLDKIKKLDYTDGKAAAEFFLAHEEYVEPNDRRHVYNITGSDKKVMVVIGEDDDTGEKMVTYVRIVDIMKLYSVQDKVIIYGEKKK